MSGQNGGKTFCVDPIMRMRICIATMDKTKLFTALVAAQKNARAVGLDAKNSHQGYRYASAESIVEEGRTALTLAGLCLLTTAVEVDAAAVPPIVTATMILAHESGEILQIVRQWPAIEQKGRPLDKAIAGALTSGLGYAIRDLLLLPRDDDFAAMDRRDDSAHDPPRRMVMSDSQPYVTIPAPPPEPDPTPPFDFMVTPGQVARRSDAASASDLVAECRTPASVFERAEDLMLKGQLLTDDQIRELGLREELALTLTLIRDALGAARSKPAPAELDSAFAKIGARAKRKLEGGSQDYVLRQIRQIWEQERASKGAA